MGRLTDTICVPVHPMDTVTDPFKTVCVDCMSQRYVDGMRPKYIAMDVAVVMRSP